jgi:hypothetical protein
MAANSIAEMFVNAGLSPENIQNIAGATGMIAATYLTHADKLVQGSFYSFGGEPVLGEFRMGPVLYKGTDDISKVVRFGETTADFSKGVRGLSFSGQIDDVFTHGLSGKGMVSGGLQHLNKLSVILPTAFTALGGMHALATEGGEGLADFLIQDFMANYYGVQNSTDVFNVKNATKADKFLGAAAGTTAVGDKIVNARTMLGSPMIGRILPTMGGYIGAALVGSAGKSLMSGYFEENEGVAGLAGMVFGSAIGARAGAYIGAGFTRLAVAGAAIASIYGTVSGGAAILKTGFRKERESRGLNYAGDVSAFLTQSSTSMRQRAVQAMQKSHLNARSAFGQEATMLHMNRDMFSHYKR